jgi:hypothetical protein
LILFLFFKINQLNKTIISILVGKSLQNYGHLPYKRSVAAAGRRGWLLAPQKGDIQ